MDLTKSGASLGVELSNGVDLMPKQKRLGCLFAGLVALIKNPMATPKGLHGYLGTLQWTCLLFSQTSPRLHTCHCISNVDQARHVHMDVTIFSHTLFHHADRVNQGRLQLAESVLQRVLPKVVDHKLDVIEPNFFFSPRDKVLLLVSLDHDVLRLACIHDRHRVLPRPVRVRCAWLNAPWHRSRTCIANIQERVRRC